MDISVVEEYNEMKPREEFPLYPHDSSLIVFNSSIVMTLMKKKNKRIF